MHTKNTRSFTSRNSSPCSIVRRIKRRRRKQRIRRMDRSLLMAKAITTYSKGILNRPQLNLRMFRIIANSNKTCIIMKKTPFPTSTLRKNARIREE
jgi:hypothetical protein